MKQIDPDKYQAPSRV